MTSLVFFGSFQDYSVQVLDKFHSHPDFHLLGVVTTPPKPGDRGILTKTPVQIYCQNNNIPVFPLENLDTIPQIDQPDFIVVAGYGKLIPDPWLNFPKIMAINIHQSLLPKYAGRFPAQWAILKGETKTGVTIIKMTRSFTDKGDILAQASLPIEPDDTSETLYRKLYDLSGDLAITTIPQIINHQVSPQPQLAKGFYARQITKEDGYFASINPDLPKMIRALNPWPGVWTYVVNNSGQKLTMKVFSTKINNQNIELEKVQISGKKPTLWSEISSHYSLIK